VSGGGEDAALVRLGIRVHSAEAESALAALLELLPDGLEERRLGDDVEYATYGASDALPDAALVRERLGPALAGLSRDPVPEDWARRWHAFLGPVTVAEGDRSLTVRPPWVPGEPGDLVVDPDVLFGAGTHPTTRLVLRLLLADPRAGGALCDWGAGTGVLAVAAARLGWAPVTAIELDAAAAEIIAGNGARNGVAVDARAGDLTADDPPWAPTVCANLFRPLLLRLAEGVARPPERLLLSGVLAEEGDEVAAAWSRRGLRETARLEEEGWAALALERT
jgi:ribosomal protein L11 methyltransferase